MNRPSVVFLGGCISVGILFNAIALRMVVLTDTRGTLFDPVLNSATHLLLYVVGLILAACHFLGLYCIYSALVALSIMFYGVYQPIQQWLAVGDPHHAFATTAYPGTILVHLFIAQAYVSSFWPCYRADKSSVWRTAQVFGAVVVLAIAVLMPFGVLSGSSCNDHPSFDVPEFSAVHRPTHFVSQYVMMRDGVKLAVDVHFPDSWKTEGYDAKMPTLIMQTRYKRNRLLQWPWNYIGLFGDVPRSSLSVVFVKFIRTFVPRGYVLVAVDVRGTGASYGNKTVDLSSAEIADYKEILDWVRQQHWYNGRVASAGVSYDGLVAGLLASHGGVDAIGLLFSPIQYTEDILAPGGVLSTSFIRLFNIFAKAQERNRRVPRKDCPQPFAFEFLFHYVVGSVLPISGQESELNAAVAEHEANWDMEEHSRKFDGFFNSIMVNDGGKEIPADDVGFNAAMLAKLAQTRTPVMTYSGYWDHASVRSSLRLHQAFGGQNVQVVMGPWAHGAMSCFTPRSSGNKVKFPLLQHLLEFFDCRLKDECTKFHARQAPFQYFQIGEEKWQSAKSFPPPQSTWHTYYLSATSGLVERAIPAQEAHSVVHRVSNQTTSGYTSRWNVISHIMGYPVNYPYRLEQSDELLTFTSQPLTSPLRMVGSAQVNITLEALEPVHSDNMVVFAYLEDVDPLAARIHYVTEAILRLGHGVTSRNPAVGAWDSVTRSYRLEDFRQPTDAVTAELSLEPIAYTFLAGHHIRLSIAGADQDNFDLASIKNLATAWKVHLGSAVLKLPVV